MGVGLATGMSAPSHANTKAIGPEKTRCGFVSDPSTYFEVLEPSAGTNNKPPMLLIHGGAHTGSCYMATADGRPGWAYAFASHGYKVVVPDWSGAGRSGHIPYETLTGEMVVRGLGKVLATLGEPAIVMTHSMSGAFGWKLLELYGDRIVALVAIAPGGPGNVNGPIELLSETPGAIEVRLAPGAPVLKLSRKAPFVAEPGWAAKKLVGTSTRFPRERLNDYMSNLNTIPPRLLLVAGKLCQ